MINMTSISKRHDFASLRSDMDGEREATKRT